jgi:hypothetical protein
VVKKEGEFDQSILYVCYKYENKMLIKIKNKKEKARNTRIWRKVS